MLVKENREERMLPAVSGEMGDATAESWSQKPCLLAFCHCSWDPWTLQKMRENEQNNFSHLPSCANL
jgi:hypothetical protein